MAKKDTWLLETNCPGLEYHVPSNNPKYKEILDAFEAGEDLAVKFAGLAKRLNDPFPEQLHTPQMYKDPAVTVKKADQDGTMEFSADEEPMAIHIFWCLWHGDKTVGFNEKYGKPMPRQVKEELARMKREEEAERKASQRFSDEGRPLGVIR